MLLAACESDTLEADIDASERIRAGISVLVLATNYSRGDTTEYFAADAAGGYLTRVYSSDTGWLEFDDCFVDTNVCGECVDEEGTAWIFEGRVFSQAESCVPTDYGFPPP